MQAAADAEGTLREQKSAVELPALLALTPPDDVELPKGDSKAVEATLENLGGAAASGVGVSAESSLETSVSPADLGTLASDESAAVTLTVAGDSAGTYDVSLDASGEEASDEATLSVVVVDAGSYLEQAKSLLEQTKTQVDSMADASDDGTSTSGGNGGKNGGGNDDRGDENGVKGGKNGGEQGNGADDEQAGGLHGLSNKLDTATKRIDDLLAAIEEGTMKERPLDNRLDALVDHVEAFQRQVAALDGKQVSAEAAGALQYNAGQVVTNLELAASAEL